MNRVRFEIARAGLGDRDAILKVMERWNMHLVPSVEMEALDLSCFFVARYADQVIGASGYKILSKTEGKTTLLGVLPEFAGASIGKELQNARLDAMYKAGIKKVTTNVDRPEVIIWYKKHFGYRQVGTIKKLCPFSLDDVDYWTTLEMDLDEYFSKLDERNARRLDYIGLNDPHPLSPYPPLIINVCLTGMVPTKLSTPYVPITADEIIEDAIKVYDAGARVVHIHARDENGLPTPDTLHYEKIISTLRRERPGLVCCATTSGRNWSDFEHRSGVLFLTGAAKPDMASLTLGSLNFHSGASVNPVEMIERLAMAMKEQGIKPELEVFDSGMVNLAKYLERHEIISGRKYFNILLGNINSAPATIGSLSALVEALPADSVWGGCGLGQFQLPMNVAAITAGGHVRVGLEDSIYYDYNKSRLTSNEELVRRLVRIADELQRPIATPEETRMMLGLREPANSLKNR